MTAAVWIVLGAIAVGVVGLVLWCIGLAAAGDRE